jgi:ribosomal protein L34E
VRLLAVLCVVAAACPAAAPAALRIVHFRTPSGNIQCGYVSGGGFAAELRCEIRSGVKPLPPKPRSCEFDWGGGFFLSPAGPARILCISDTIQVRNPPVLAYGHTWHGGPFTCLSQAVGLRCSNRAGYGFFLSAQHSYAFHEASASNGAFKTPSGNIVCGYDTRAGSAVECGIKSGLRPPPKAVQCDAGDFSDKRISLHGTGRATLGVCAGDPGPLLPEVQAKAAVLPYGASKRIGAIVCTSKTTGLTCRNASGHGFFLSRERSYAF